MPTYVDLFLDQELVGHVTPSDVFHTPATAMYWLLSQTIEKSQIKNFNLSLDSRSIEELWRIEAQVWSGRRTIDSR